MRRVLIRMVNRIPGDDVLCLVEIIPARVQIPVEAGKVAAADLNPDAMTWRKIITRREQIDLDFVNLIRLHPNHFAIPFSIACTEDPFLDDISRSVWSDIHEFGREVRIFCR